MSRWPPATRPACPRRCPGFAVSSSLHMTSAEPYGESGKRIGSLRFLRRLPIRMSPLPPHRPATSPPAPVAGPHLLNEILAHLLASSSVLRLLPIAPAHFDAVARGREESTM
uniref:Uncharacterized protein n=1 Tax=Arundo donax TaxID=35708 RepID=A0A0A8Y173_ARUDO